MKKFFTLYLLVLVGNAYAMERDATMADVGAAFDAWVADLEDGGAQVYPATCYRPDGNANAGMQRGGVSNVRRGRELNDGGADEHAVHNYAGVAAQLGASRRAAAPAPQAGGRAGANARNQPPLIQRPKTGILTKVLVLSGVGGVAYLVYTQFFADKKEEPVFDS